MDGVLWSGALAGTDEMPLLPASFPVLKAALARAPRWLLAVRPADGEVPDPRTAGLRGLFRTVAREYPQMVARIIEVSDSSPSALADAVVADAVVAEAVAWDRTPVVLRTAAGRHGFELVAAPLGVLGSTGAGPAGAGTPEATALGLDQDSVVLLAGGARGITAQFAAVLAGAARCRLELLGRTPAPDGPEAADTASARTPAELRAALAARGGLKPAEINRAAELLLAQREITATLTEITASGGRARYRSVDFREPDAVLQAVKEIHAEHGKLDGVVHAAGVIEDRLIAEKSTESFRRVYATKATGADALLTALEELPAPPAFTVLFGSISAVLGNRGQVDYAAANDALETLGAAFAARTGRMGGDRALGPLGTLGRSQRHDRGRAGPGVRPARHPADRPGGGDRGAAAGARLGRGVRHRRRLHRLGLVTVVVAPPRHGPGTQAVAARQVPVAIVGMAVLLPGAADLDAYWRNLRDGVDAIGAVPDGRWDAEYYHPGTASDPAVANQVYARRGGFVDGLAQVEVTRFGIMPNSVAGTEPDQLIALHVASAALDDAGGTDRLPDRGRVGVVLGRGGYLTPGLVRLDQRVRTALPTGPHTGGADPGPDG